MPIQDVSILFLISLVAFVNATVLAWAARLGAARTPALLFSLGSFLLAIAPLTVLVVAESGSPWRAAGLNLLPILSYTCWLLGTLHFCGRRQYNRWVLIAVALLLVVVIWLTWVNPARDLRIFLVTFSLALLRTITATVLIRFRGALDQRVAWVFAGVMLVEAAAMLIRSITVLVGDLPSIGADAQSTTSATWLAILLATVLSTPLLTLLGLSRLISDLRRSSTRLRATLDAMPDDVLELDAGGQISAVHSKQPELLAALTPAGHYEQTVGSLPPALAAALRSVMAEVDRHGRSTGVQYTLTRADGEHCFEISAATRPALESEHAAGYVVVTRDISERIRIERMKREFVSVVSHELRTPLTSISGALDLLMGGAAGPLPAPATQLLTIAQSNGQRLRLLINDLLDMEKLIAGKMRFDVQSHLLRPLLQAAVDSNQTFGGTHSVTLKLVEPFPAIYVAVDGQRLTQVLSNLLSNAIKFSPANGEVQIRCRDTDGRVRVSVCDQGPGVPAEFRARLFEKFSQADSSDSRQKHGSGLGLAIVREMIERMNGTVGYEANDGGGACFYFELPIVTTIPDHPPTGRD